MQWSDIPFQPANKKLRHFAALWLVGFGVLACWYAFVRHNLPVGLFLGALALTVGPVGIARPGFIRPIFIGWMVAAFPVGWVISRMALGLAFYGVFTPIALAFKLCGRDVLDRSFQPEQQTYWTPKPAPREVLSYFHQF
jgi:hypothetical protein